MSVESATNLKVMNSSAPVEDFKQEDDADGVESDDCKSEVEDESFQHAQVGSCRVWLPAQGVIVSNPEFCPNVVSEYLLPNAKGNMKDLTDRVRKHLLFLGWKIEYFKEVYNMTRMRYTSPDGKVYMSLVKVCKALTECTESPSMRALTERAEDRRSRNVTCPTPACTSGGGDPVFEPEYCPEAVVNWSKFVKSKGLRNDQSVELDSLKAKKHLSAMGWWFTYCYKVNKRELRYWSPSGKCFYSLRKACEACIKDNGTLRFEESGDSNTLKLTNDCQSQSEPSLVVEIQVEEGKRKETKKKTAEDDFDIESARGSKRRRTEVKSKPAVRSRKRVREAAVHTPSHNNPRTVLSWLIDQNAVPSDALVQYISRKNGQPLKEGWVSREGIRCKCCDMIYALSAFEAHAGSTAHRPAANIFLQDGRSLMECQRQTLNITTELKNVKRSDRQYPNNEDLCSVCHGEGQLILCDNCPSSFHMTCLGLKEIPDGDWFCESCCCVICGRGEFEANITDNDVLRCYQCEHKYHLSCLKREYGVELHTDTNGKCFCSMECKKICSGLRSLLGRPFTLGSDNLTWTLVAAGKCGSSQNDSADIDMLTENHSKLSIALSVMHECFEPLIDPCTKRDIHEDVIFSRSSEYSRLNYRGFYTVLLEKNDELISAATVRIFGHMVAEVPFVGTSLRYRRLGMCRVLMNELEKKLKELGIERLVLPAVPNVLSTWTGSFGFSQMTKSERLKLLSYPLLDFVDTTLCEKTLVRTYRRNSFTRTQA